MSVGDGPGRLVLVAGPSGSGKDTLIRGARDALVGDGRFVFPRRVVTRPTSEWEDNEACAPADFAERAARGDFAVTWDAHGLRYGVPASIVTDVAEGRSVIVNVSRKVVPDLRARFARVVAVAVTAPTAILSARIAARGRAEDGDLRRRLDHTIEVGRADLTIVNDGTIESALQPLLRLLHAVA